MSVQRAVLPAAGLGTRFLPATKSQPKEMLPLVDKPLIQYVVEEAVTAGIDNLIMVTGRGKSAIEDHFDVSFELERFLEDKGKREELAIVKAISDLVTIFYVRQKEALGLGHAVLVAEELVRGEAFAVMLGDDLIRSEVPCIEQLTRIHEQREGPVLAVMRVPKSEISAYGVISADKIGHRLYRVNDMIEKPASSEAPSDLAIIGRYVLTPDIFSHLAHTTPDVRGEIQLTDALRSLSAERALFAYEFEGERHDCGNKLGFLRATVDYALARADLKDAFGEALRELLPRYVQKPGT